jgi:hypothetical protein
MITKTAIGNYLRKQPNGDVGMYRNGFKDGVQWAQQRLAAPQQDIDYWRKKYADLGLQYDKLIQAQSGALNDK